MSMLASQHTRLNALDFSATAHRRENVCRDRIWNHNKLQIVGKIGIWREFVWATN
jgi:hypothetical protein